jgi:penicillin-binding protein 1C
MRFAMAAAGAALALALAAVVADRLYPLDLSRYRPSTVVEDRHGAMLRAFQTPDQQWRLAVEPRDVSPAYRRLLIDVEDKRFWHHPGFDPFALIRAVAQVATHGHVVSGGSTLTMQVVRLLEPRPRTLRSKIIELARAAQLEAHLSKTEILRLYLTLTPMGGNLEGVRAGSLAWFGKEPNALSDAEAALLVALPQAPRRNRPDAHPAVAEAARAKILALARQDGLIDSAAQRSALSAPLPTHRHDLPQIAPHLAEKLAKETPDRVIRTTLERDTQIAMQRVLRQTLGDLPRPVNLAALVVDWRTGAVLARVGSGAYYDNARSGMIDMTSALRSPGSTLKPFIYGMGFEALLAHPMSLVRDEPTRFDDYAPHNFDGGFNGDVTVRQALQASLNLPAVIMLQKLGPIAFADRFREAGLPLSFEDDTIAPSLPMALGGVGLTLEELVQAYTALADGGAVKPLITRLDGSAQRATPTKQIMSRPAADAVVDILSDMPPPRGLASHAGRIAYKTGTSYRFRDGWAIGFDNSRVIGVWMGRADGGTCVTCVGVASAGILFRLFDTLAPDPIAKRRLAPIFAGPPPAALVRLAPANAGPVASEPRITFPLAGARLLADAGAPDVKLAVDGGRRPYRWLVDGQPIESRPFAHEAAWHPSGEGFSQITVIDALGRSDEIRIRILGRAAAE